MFESELAPIFDKLGYGSTTWAPLANGLLTGKYNDGKFPEGTRLAGEKLSKVYQDTVMGWYKDVMGDNLYPALRALGELAKELGCTQAQLSLAWCIVNQNVSVCLIGASKAEQVIENLGALEVAKKWTKEIEDKVEAIIKSAPSPLFNWRDWKPFPFRREMVVKLQS